MLRTLADDAIFQETQQKFTNMKFTLSWLKQYFSTNASLEQIIFTLNQVGIEVESFHDYAQQYQSFEIAEILETSPHPDAGNLQVCRVNTSNGEAQIVCGAANARAGIKVVLAPIGAIIPQSGMQIKAAKIRGIESQGMLCSEKELMLSDEHAGIIELSLDAPVGMKFALYRGLDDAVIEVGLTPNRGDAASVLGLARDLAAAGLGELKLSNSLKVEIDNMIQAPRVVIQAPAGGWQFYGRYIYNVDNMKPVTALAEQLQKVGSSSINALVDISNYTMFSYGRPNHIYDADKIVGRLSVRFAENNEKFIALGGMEYLLDKEILVVADEQKVLAVAGVMGGELSKVDITTKNVLIEVAQFDPIAVAIAGRKLELHSDSRYRFERRVDSANSALVMDYITTMIHENCGGKASAVVEVLGTAPEYVKEVAFKKEDFERIAGFEITESEIERILVALGFSYKENKVVIPSWRWGDIVGSADIVEEILRIYGYHRIPNSKIVILPEELKLNNSSNEELARRAMMDRGFIEQITWSFISAKACADFEFEELISLQNPIIDELSVMRPSAVPNLLDKLQKNSARGEDEVAFFEIGDNYGKKLELLQQKVVTLLRSGDIINRNVHGGQRKVDFYDIKADVFYLLEKIKYNPVIFNLNRAEVTYYHPGKSATLSLGKKIIAHLGELHPAIAKLYDFKEPVFIAEIFMGNLPIMRNKAAKNKLQLSDYQAVHRDFAFLIASDITVYSVTKEIAAVNKELIEKVEVFDIYQGEKVGEGNKSIALRIKLQPYDRTLRDEEINGIANEVINMMTHKFGAQLRG